MLYWTGLLFLSAVTTNASQFLPFIDAFSSSPDATTDYNDTRLLNDRASQWSANKRDSPGCPTQYSNCQSLGAPQLCCANTAVCTADSAGHVACCPTGAVCTGTITGVIPSGGTATVTSTASTTTTSNSVVVVTTTSTTNGAFIVAGTTTVATPAGAIRRAEVPFFAEAAIALLGIVGLL